MNPSYNAGYKAFSDTCAHLLAVTRYSPCYSHTKLTSGTQPNLLFYDLIHNSPRNLNLKCAPIGALTEVTVPAEFIREPPLSGVDLGGQETFS